MSTIIKVEDLSKQYRLGQVSTGTISHDVNRWWHRVRGKEDPYLKIGETNDRTATGNSDYVWALKDINFEVKQGEVLGIIGRNGAGKSTLLKILSRTTAPTTGSIKIKGRVASLLEVGTGFHPELSGRENIYLNGAILGMTKKEITRKFDEIVAFAGVERYIDTPVKRYSSGMYVRLAFAVAAHLEPEILIVDEVLAVGDAEFQKKCLGKMKDVSEKDGRTVLFVSHNMGAVSQLCNRGMLMEYGTVTCIDTTRKTVDRYLAASKNNPLGYNASIEDASKECQFISIQTVNVIGEYKDEFAFSDSIRLSIRIKAKKLTPDYFFGIGLVDRNGNRVTTIIQKITELVNSQNGVFECNVLFPASVIAPNNYSFDCAIYDYTTNINFDFVESACSVIVVDDGTEFSKYEGANYGSVILNPVWESKK